MRHSEQLPLTPPWIGHVHAAELTAISALLDGEPRIAALVEQDLLRKCVRNARTGRPGLTGDQVIRMALVRQMNTWTYAELAFHLADSASYRTFCRVGPFVAPPSKSALAANIRLLRPATLRAINDLVVTSAAARRVEPGRTVRIDSTVVEELAVRSALGANRSRIIVQLFAEALVFGGVAAAVGLAAAIGPAEVTWLPIDSLYPNLYNSSVQDGVGRPHCRLVP